MSMTTRAGALAAALLLATVPVFAQQGAADPAAAVPETRYQPAHAHRTPPPSAATPDRNWQAGNRAVTPAAPKADPKVDPHAGHAGHGHHAAPPKQEAAADPHAHHHDHGDIH